MFWEPHEYQKEAVKFLVERGSAALWLDPGLGKTAIVLSALSMVLATVAVEAGMEEEKAVYAFRKSFGSAERRLKRVLKEAH